MNLSDPRDPKSLSNRFRARRDVLLRKTIAARVTPGSSFRIIDLGGSDHYWARFGLDFLERNGIEVTLLNLEPREMRDSPLKTMVADACNVPADDNSFDFVHSNSVIEHLRTWENMQRFAREVRRLAPGYYVQTPNWWFPIDPHYFKAPLFHWMPKAVRAQILYRFSVAHSGKVRPMDRARHAVGAAKLLTARQMRELFPDSDLHREKFAGLTKSLISIRL